MPLHPATGFIDALRESFDSTQLLLDPADRWPYGYDNSRLHQSPIAVVLPDNSEQIQNLVRLCRHYQSPLVVRGSGTGTTGAAVPAVGGLVMSTERMNRILRVDPDNRLMEVEPGVTNQQVQQAAAEHGFFWPPDPTSTAVCTIGGNIACNAAGPRAVKYGTPRDNLLGLQLVTASGELIHTGTHTTKGVVGYDLTRLIAGSEGSLAIITQATLKLTPLAEARRTLRVLYSDIHAAARAVSRIMAQPVIPCALEFMDAGALAMIRDYGQLELMPGTAALLMIEVDGPASCIEQAAEAVLAAANGEGCLECVQARNEAEVAQLWMVRKALSPALRTVAPKKINEDVVVPVSRIPDLLAGIEQLAAAYAIRVVNFGHAGNGNIHVNLLVDPNDGEQMSRAEACLSDLFDLVLRLQGTLSGEHGIGLVKKPFVSREIEPAALALMHGIKQVFDPDNILNPGKGF